MHDPEFEKHIQRKMGELDFTPSESVWNKVEAEIEKDKRRRRPHFLAVFISRHRCGRKRLFFIRTCSTPKINAADVQTVAPVIKSNPASGIQQSQAGVRQNSDSSSSGHIASVESGSTNIQDQKKPGETSYKKLPGYQSLSIHHNNKRSLKSSGPSPMPDATDKITSKKVNEVAGDNRSVQPVSTPGDKLQNQTGACGWGGFHTEDCNC